MIKPKTLRIWCCVRYYLALCLAKGQSSETVRNKRSGLKKFFLWCLNLNVHFVDQITIDLMDDYLEYLNSYRKKLDHQPLSDAQKRSLLTFVKTFIQYLHRKGIIAENTLASIELPSRGFKVPKALYSVQEIELILDQTLLFPFKGFRDRAILELFFATGMRRGELSKVNLNDIWLEEQKVKVQGKGRRERILPLKGRAFEWVVFYISKIRPKFAQINSGNALFLCENGKRISPSKLTHMVSQYIKLAGIERPGACHLFRHAAATEMLENDASLRHIQEFLGHASILTTQIYTHVSKAKLISVYMATHPSAQEKSGLFD
ncbi:tyrosine-type recombinase/integrase [Parashewanella tropica]|uniref:tyrosine-type recombinase/integrase n=1 Tax=Parashewanella tropica TaxID=2547970 RepID=UPI00105A425E|nr:tyrosine-type recombinase/integrase [Parashewanella tropica]